MLLFVDDESLIKHLSQRLAHSIRLIGRELARILSHHQEGRKRRQVRVLHAAHGQVLLRIVTIEEGDGGEHDPPGSLAIRQQGQRFFDGSGASRPRDYILLLHVLVVNVRQLGLLQLTEFVDGQAP